MIRKLEKIEDLPIKAIIEAISIMRMPMQAIRPVVNSFFKKYRIGDEELRIIFRVITKLGLYP